VIVAAGITVLFLLRVVPYVVIAGVIVPIVAGATVVAVVLAFVVYGLFRLRYTPAWVNVAVAVIILTRNGFVSWFIAPTRIVATTVSWNVQNLTGINVVRIVQTVGL
jgi:hypothetical protein